jgi:hypothetical protein
MPSWFNPGIPPPPPRPQSREAWGLNHKIDVSIAHILALIRDEQPTLALGNCDVAEHWDRLVSKSSLCDACIDLVWRWAVLKSAKVQSDPAGADGGAGSPSALFAQWWEETRVRAGLEVPTYFA